MAHARTLLAITFLAAVSVASADRTVQVSWGDKKRVNAVISYPKAGGKVPVLMIASGRSGGMNSPIIKGFADKALRDGLAVVRFDYAYYAAKGEPTQGLTDETTQFKAVLAEALKDPKIDSKRVVLAGKSLGSVVAHRVFQEVPSYLGEILLTPVIPTQDDGERLYPGLVLAKRPTVVVIGNADTENAPLGVVYSFFKDASRKIMVDIVAGDHSYMVSPGTDSASQLRNRMNADAALEMAQYWVRNITRVMPPAYQAPKPATKKG